MSGILGCDWWRDGHVTIFVWIFPAFSGADDACFGTLLDMSQLDIMSDAVHYLFSEVMNQSEFSRTRLWGQIR